MKTVFKRVLSVQCLLCSLSLLSFADLDQSQSAASENWRNGSHVLQYNPNFSYTSLPAFDLMQEEKEVAAKLGFSYLKVDNNILKIDLEEVKPTSIQIFNADGKTKWYEFFAKKTHAIRPNLSKGVYIARLYQGETYHTTTFTIQ